MLMDDRLLVRRAVFGGEFAEKRLTFPVEQGIFPNHKGSVP